MLYSRYYSFLVHPFWISSRTTIALSCDLLTSRRIMWIVIYFCDSNNIPMLISLPTSPVLRRMLRYMSWEQRTSVGKPAVTPVARYENRILRWTPTLALFIACLKYTITTRWLPLAKSVVHDTDFGFLGLLVNVKNAHQFMLLLRAWMLRHHLSHGPQTIWWIYPASILSPRSWRTVCNTNIFIAVVHSAMGDLCPQIGYIKS